MTNDRYAFCPNCGDTITFKMYGEWQGVPPYTGYVSSLDEIQQECTCPLTESELMDLYDISEECYDD
jgi:hypothetical protein